MINSGYTFNKADMNAQDELGNTPLIYAAEHGNRKMVEYLLDKGALTNVKNDEKNTPLHFAFKSGKIKVIIPLIKAGGSLNVINKFGSTPLGMGTNKILEQLN